MSLYIERNGVPVPATPREWEAWWIVEVDRLRRVGLDEVGGNGPAVSVSTVFLGVDHNFSGEGAPVLYETMVFGGSLDMESERYRTRDEAVAGHAKWVAAARAGVSS